VPWVKESWRSIDALNYPSIIRDEDRPNACMDKRRASSRFILRQYAIPLGRCPESAENEGAAPGIGDAVSNIAPGAGTDMAASKAAA